MDRKDMIQTTATVAVLIGAIVSATAYFAKADDMNLIAQRLEQKIASDASYQMDQRKWQILNRNEKARECSDIKDERDRDECRMLEKKIKEFDKMSEMYMQKMVK
jgi:hypothetical protein